MGETIGFCQRRARKNHPCEWCLEPIEKGAAYFRWAWVDCGEADESKMHKECYSASMELIDIDGFICPGFHRRGGSCLQGCSEEGTFSKALFEESKGE